MAGRPRYFYGWVIIAASWIIYGFGISPAYYSWGQFAPAIIADLDVNREAIGGVFGLFTFLYSGVGPLVGLAQSRWGLRSIMILGLIMSTAGFFLMSRADSLLDCYLAFGLLGGAGIGFSTIVPCQTLGSNWFLKYRARAIAIIFTAGGIVGMVVPKIDKFILDQGHWQDGWLYIAVISATLSLIALLFIRDTPESMGQFIDGEARDPLSVEVSQEGAPLEVDAREWTAAQAIRTPQFALIVLCGTAYAVPWGVVTAHGRLHLGDMGLSSATIASVYGFMILISIAGRFSGSLGDWITPQKVLGVSLLVEGCGVAGLPFADVAWKAYACFTLVGMGFGAAYISIPLVFADYFGRRAFATTSGTRILITGVLNGMGPWLAGMASDQLGSYTLPFTVLFILTMLGAASAFLSPRPGAPPIIDMNILRCTACSEKNGIGTLTCQSCGASLRPSVLAWATTAGPVLLFAAALAFAYLRGFTPVSLIIFGLFLPGLVALPFMRNGSYRAWMAVQVAWAIYFFGSAAAAFVTNKALLIYELPLYMVVGALWIYLQRTPVRIFCSVGRRA